MVLTLYHDDLKPEKVYNVIKVSIDNERTVKVTIKHGVNIEHKSFVIYQNYQQLTVQLD